MLRGVSQIRAAYVKGKFDDIIQAKGKDKMKAMKKKSVKVEAWGWKETDENSVVEEELIEWLK